jgi:hypothetical protein
MATDNGNWETLPVDAGSAQKVAFMYNDARLQQDHPSWPTGGTEAQLKLESGPKFNPNAVSDKGAVGEAQVIPKTNAAINARVGRTLDPRDPADALELHYQVMKENLDHFGDPSKAVAAYNGGWTPSKWGNAETSNYVNNWDNATGGAVQKASTNPASDDSDWETVSPASASSTKPVQDADAGWETVQPQSSALGAAARGAERSALPTAAGVASFAPGAEIGGLLGSPLGPIGAGVGALAGGLTTSLGGGYLANKAQDYLLKQFPDAAKAIGLGNEQQAADQAQHPLASFAGGLAPQILAMRPGEGINPVTGASRGLLDLMGRGTGAIIGGGQEAASEYAGDGPMDPAKIALATGAGALMNRETALGAKLRGVGESVVPANLSPSKQAQQAQIDSLMKAAQDQTDAHMGTTDNWNDVFSQAQNAPENNQMRQTSPSDAPDQEPTQPIGPDPRSTRQGNLDLQQPTDPLYVNPQGDVNTQLPGESPDRIAMAQRAAQDEAQRQQQNQNGDLFGNTGEGNASPFDPNRMAGEGEPTPMDHTGQGNLDLQSPDSMTRRIAGLEGAEPAQLDMFNPIDQRRFDQFGNDPDGRVLNRDEFEKTLDNLQAVDETRFPEVPDRDAAWEAYQRTVDDGQGRLFDRPTMAENFAKLAKTEATARMVENHPTVKANQAKVDALQAQVTQSRVGGKFGPRTQKLQAQLNEAKATLEKSKINIGAQMEKAAVNHATAKDGITYLHAGIHLPTMLKTLAGVLKNLHGAIFQYLDRKYGGSPTKADSFGGIVKSALIDRINKEATRKWETTENGNARNTLQGVAALRKGLNEFTPYEAQGKSVDDVASMAATAPDLNSNALTKMIAQGGLMMTNISKGNPVVKYISERVDRAIQNHATWNRQNLTGPNGLRTKIMGMSTAEQASLWNVMRKFEGREADVNESVMKQNGLNDKQIAAYKQFRDLDDQVYTRMNNARDALGLPPVDKRINHLVGLFTGDFRRLIHEVKPNGETGRVVAVMGHNTQMGVRAQTKAFMESHPNPESLRIGDIIQRKLPTERKSDDMDNLMQNHMEILNTLAGMGNKDVQHMIDAYQVTNGSNMEKLMGMANRAKEKGYNTVGAEGFKTWETEQQNAVNGFKAQLRHLESSDKWSEMTSANIDSKSLLTHPALEGKQQQAKTWSRDYLDNAMGRPIGKVTELMNGLLNNVATMTGVGPSVYKNLNNATKSLMLEKFVGMFKLSHSLVTAVQPFQANGPLMSLLKARGVDFGEQTGGIAMLKGLGTASKMWRGDFEHMNDFEKAQYAYMKTNNIDNVNMSEHMNNITNPGLEKAKHIAELNVSLPEQGARSYLFSSYSHLLNNAGMPKEEIFPTARNMVRYAMVDYSPHERPLIFGKMGLLGDIASTLTRFKFNQISQHINAGKTGIVPLLHLVATSAVLGGIRGIFGYNMANEATDQITKHLAGHGIIKDSFNLDDILLAGLHNAKTKMGIPGKVTDLASMGAFSAVGLNMTGSFTNADVIPNDPLATFVPYGSEVTKMASTAGDLMFHHNSEALKKAAMAWSPNSMQGLEENYMFGKPNASGGRDIENPFTTNLKTRRDATAVAQRNFSFRPAQEGKDQLIRSNVQMSTDRETDQRNMVLDKAKSQVRSNGSLTPEQYQEYAQDFNRWGGKDFAQEFSNYLGKGQHMTDYERSKGQAETLGDALKYNKFKNRE